MTHSEGDVTDSTPVYHRNIKPKMGIDFQYMDRILGAFKTKKSSILRMNKFWGLSYTEFNYDEWDIPPLPCHINMCRQGHSISGIDWNIGNHRPVRM